MPRLCSLPHDLASCNPQVGNSPREITVDRSQYRRDTPTPHQSAELAQLGLFYSFGDFGVDGRYAFHQGCSHLRPTHRVSASHHDELFGSYAKLPRRGGAQPPSGVYICDGALGGVLGQKRQTQPCKPKSGVADEAGDPSRFESQRLSIKPGDRRQHSVLLFPTRSRHTYRMRGIHPIEHTFDRQVRKGTTRPRPGTKPPFGHPASSSHANTRPPPSGRP